MSVSFYAPRIGNALMGDGYIMDRNSHLASKLQMEQFQLKDAMILAEEYLDSDSTKESIIKEVIAGGFNWKIATQVVDQIFDGGW